MKEKEERRERVDGETRRQQENKKIKHAHRKKRNELSSYTDLGPECHFRGVKSSTSIPFYNIAL